MYPRNDEGFARAFADVRWSVRTHKRSFKVYVGRLDYDRYTVSRAEITPPFGLVDGTLELVHTYEDELKLLEQEAAN